MSVVSAAAYRSSTKLWCRRHSIYYSYTRYQKPALATFIIPPHAPTSYTDRETLWNAVEDAERQKNSQLARTIEFSLPWELDFDDAASLAREYVESSYVGLGMLADLTIHHRRSKAGPPNLLAKLMLTTRGVDNNGFLGLKDRSWNSRSMLIEWRRQWAAAANQRFEQHGLACRMDHRTYKDQGIDIEAQNKVGRGARRMASEGATSERVAEHLAIAVYNGNRIVADPRPALDLLRKRFHNLDDEAMVRFAQTQSVGEEQFTKVLQSLRKGFAVLIRED